MARPSCDVHVPFDVFEEQNAILFKVKRNNAVVHFMLAYIQTLLHCQSGRNGKIIGVAQMTENIVKILSQDPVRA